VSIRRYPGRPALRIGPPPFADIYLHRLRLLVADLPLAVHAALAQVVDVRHRNRRQSLVALIAIVVKLSVENLLRRRPAQRFMRLVHARQQLDVGWRVPADEPVPSIAALFHHPALLIPPDQPRHLCPAQTGHLAKVLTQHSLGFAPLPEVLVLYQGPRHPLVNLLPLAAFKSEFFAGLQERLHLFQAQPLSASHADDQYPACGLTPPSGSLCVRNTPCLQAHLALYKTPGTEAGNHLVY